jgi:hypothetical protein
MDSRWFELPVCYVSRLKTAFSLNPLMLQPALVIVKTESGTGRSVGPALTAARLWEGSRRIIVST